MCWYSKSVSHISHILCYFNFISLIIFARTPKLLGQEEEGKSKPPGFEVEALCKDCSLDMSLYKITYKAAKLSSWEDVALSKKVIKGTSAIAF